VLVLLSELGAVVVGGGGGVADVGGAGGARDGDVKDGLGLVGFFVLFFWWVFFNARQ